MRLAINQLVCSLVPQYAIMHVHMYSHVHAIRVYVSQHHFRLYDIREGGRRDVAAIQFPQPPGPPGGTDGLQSTLVIELVLPTVGQVDCICLLAILSSLQTLDDRQ